jgi:hypothetical protein
MANPTPHTPPSRELDRRPDVGEYDVDAQSEDSFPASDPPSYSGSVVGGPRARPMRRVKRAGLDLGLILAGVVLVLVGIAVFLSARAH